VAHISESCTPLRSVVWRGEVYRPGDHVVVLVDGSVDCTHPQNWKAVINCFFMHECNGHMEIFFEAEWYKQRFEEDTRRQVLSWDRDEYSHFTLLDRGLLHAHGNNCRSLSRILHKFFPISQGGVVVALEIGDTLFRELPSTIANCPPFPEVGDILTAIADDSALNGSTIPELCVVREVILQRHTNGIDEDDDALESESEGDDSEIEVVTRSDDADRSELDLGQVGVTWLSVVGSRTDSSLYKAGLDIDKFISFQRLIQLRTDFCTKKMQNGVPIRWEKL
jgi:hypothetical protein